MFSLTTVAITMFLYTLLISFVDNRGFPGPRHAPLSGPIGYQVFILRGLFAYFPTIVLFLNNWLIEGLLLYRCFVIYNMNYPAIAFPCLMHFASSTLGVLILSQSARRFELVIATYSITHSLNILLTLMIVLRVIIHARGFRNTTGKSCRVYNTIATILVESCVLYTVPLLLCFIPLAINSSAEYIFLAGCIAAQPIAPFFIILRVASQTAFAPYMAAVSGSNSSIHYNSQRGLAGGSTTNLSPTSTTRATGEIPGELCTGAESSRGIIGEVPMNGDKKALKNPIP